MTPDTYQDQWQDRALALHAAVEHIVMDKFEPDARDAYLKAWNVAYKAWVQYERSFAEGVDFNGDQA